MIFILTIELGNDAMQTGYDVAEALRVVANKIQDHDASEDYGNRIGDMNGNKVGEWGFQQ